MSHAASLFARGADLAFQNTGPSRPQEAETDGSSLRVGLLVDSLSQPKWIWNIIRDIQASSTSKIVAVILNRAANDDVDGVGNKSRETRDHLLYALYSRLDRYLFSAQLDPLAPADILPLIGGSTRIDVTSETVDGADSLSDRNMEDILAQRLDVALYFGTRDLRGRTLGIAKHGVWAYHHGESFSAPGSPVGFWEVMERRSTTRSALYVLSDGPERHRVIYHSSARTHPRSVMRNQANALWKASAFVTRKLRDLSEDGPGALQGSQPRAPDRPRSPNHLRPVPTNGEMLRLFSGLVGRYLGSRLRHYIEAEQWFLVYDIRNSTTESEGLLRAPARATQILPPKDRFWADPFPVRKSGGYYVFFEERPFLTRKGFLSVLEIDDAGRVSSPTKVLERDYHLSYPFIFQWNGTHYLIPESAANKTVELYRAIEFPYRWELDRVLLHDVKAVDTTVQLLRNRWWMFVNIAVPGASSCDELHLYHAKAPIGPWLPHRLNPVKSDARGARPAGRIFTYRDELYRPAQDCSTRYGGSITINKILRLDTDAYEEMEVSNILPDWQPNLVATHTINSVDGLTVMDAKRIRPRWKRSR